MSRGTMVGIALVAVVALGGGAFWWSTKQQLAYEYADALALCERSPAEGAAKVKALDQLHGGLTARPAELRLSLANCVLDDSLARLEYYNRLLVD